MPAGRCRRGRLHRRGGIGAGSGRMRKGFPGGLPGCSSGPLWEGPDHNWFCWVPENKVGGTSGPLQQFHQKVQRGQRPRSDPGTKKVEVRLVQQSPTLESLGSLSNGHLAGRVPDKICLDIQDSANHSEFWGGPNPDCRGSQPLGWGDPDNDQNPRKPG